MTPFAPARRLLWPLVVAALAVGLTAAAVFLRRPETARAESPADAATAAGGVVCFGTVDLEHGVTSLFPLQPGRVAEVPVRESQEVAEGTVLIRLEDGAARHRLAEAEAGVELSRLRLKEARKLPEQRRSRVAQQEAAQEAVNSRLAAARHVLAQRQKQTQPALAAAVEVFSSEVLVRELEAQARVEAERLAEMKGQDVESEVRRAEYELAAAGARRSQARLALDECGLKAPRRGTVLRILVGPGDVLAAERGQPALLFAADGPQVVRATVEQEFAPRIREGQPALVQDEADASASLRGRVARLAAWYSQRRTVLHDPSQLSDVRTLECDIVLEPGQPRLRLGQGVRVLIGPVPP
jgi:multidrug resistance efflux pump